MKLLYKNTNLITQDQILDSQRILVEYIKHIQDVAQKSDYESLEASINLPSDEKVLNDSKELYKKVVTPQLKYIIDIGIGGSNLGTKAIYDAKYGFFDLLEPNRYPKMFFADTNDPEFLEKLVAFLTSHVSSPEEILVCAISKSGGTTETIANFEILYSALSQKFSDIKNRVVAITDFESKFWNAAQKIGIATLSIPKQVGGRFSVLSAVGLFPLLAAGIDVESLRKGAMDIRTKCVSQNIEENPALVSASILFHCLQNDRVINDTFLFHQELESLGKWYRQLMGESIGKETDLDGKTVNTGITPTISLGSTDLHSVGQLYLGGPKDKVTTFVYTEKSSSVAKTPEQFLFPDLVEHITNKKASDIMHAILEGVKAAYIKRGLSFMEIVLDDMSEKSIGEFLQFKMIEMMYLGRLMNVNTFDQPNVESYKIETKKILVK